MRPSRMMLVFFLLPFTFAAMSSAGAETERIPVGKKEMWVHKDANGKVTKVTDNNGNEARKGSVEELKILLGGTEYKIFNVSEGAEIRTLGSECVWRFYGGGWHQVCSYP